MRLFHILEKNRLELFVEKIMLSIKNNSTKVLLLLILLLKPSYALASTVEIIRRYFSAISAGEFISAAKLFKYPHYSSDDEYRNDIQAVSSDLNDFVSGFGIAKPLSQENAVDGAYVGFGVSAGTPNHVEMYSPQNVIHLQATFSKIGRGYFSFLFNKTDGKEELIMIFLQYSQRYC